MASTTSTPLILTTLLALQLIPAVLSAVKIVPSDSSKLDEWIAQNLREYNEHEAAAKGTRIAVDECLWKAEKRLKVIKVKKDGTGDFTNVTAAVDSIPDGNKRRVVIWIGGGMYWEKITIFCTKPFVTFYGDPNDIPMIAYDGTASQYGTVYSATVAVESDYFMAVNIAFANGAPMPDGRKTGAQAVAMRISGDKAAFHNCRFIGFQDTLCDDRGKHLFKDCYIQGTVDFIFGNGKSVYLNSTINSVAKEMGVITAQARENVTDDSGFTFLYCNITGTGNTYLGRAWKERPRVVFAYTHMGTLINPQGWNNALHVEREKTVYYGEYKCKGPGAAPSRRVKYSKILSDKEAKPFLSMTYIQGSKWLLLPPKL